ncbi:hypothetical protein EZJ43_11735 [Pedobacter changchengzhani]|uniref:Uncharacterized protein n=1 Tax=Pedobacter changchengzhani TaxID=2529274 RepID=A0A4R5MJV8_9SPHI|nr:DUF2683 family protein [Pedobacter changchengzhani]TDG35686.1 hypothetical protein EZJ43_11735 [Pedobacter changchengzhani]
MEAFTLHTENKEQTVALKAFAKLFKLRISKKELDETDYLNSTEANRKALDDSSKQAENGQYKKIDIADLWK